MTAAEVIAKLETALAAAREAETAARKLDEPPVFVNCRVAIQALEGAVRQLIAAPASVPSVPPVPSTP